MAEQANDAAAADANPYAAPQSALREEPSGPIELASRWQRFFAAIVDGICLAGIGILGAILIPALQKSSLGTNRTAVSIVAVVMIVGFLAVIVVNIWLLYTRAATIGKLALGIRIARTDGTQPSVGRLLFLRGLPQWLVSLIPYAGSLLQLIDILFIFGEERRCVHDHIADTIVIKVPSGA
jgi:uncharacterized RDD family membrane protein YckC